MTDNNSRLDIAVQKKLTGQSRSTASKLIEAGQVTVNSFVITKPSFKIGSQDKLDIDLSLIKKKTPNISPPVIYEDNDVVVINKPSGLLTHSKGAFNPEATVASWLKHLYKGPSSDRAGIVHRLDRLTSGVMVVAKNEPASKWLQKQFSTRKVKKTYIAIVGGHLNHPQAIIDMPIERNPKSPQSFRVGPTGKNALTEYTVIESNDKYSMIELKPTTGRTHQLRVHLAHLNHPVVGDNLYNGQPADRLYLHAKYLELTLPNKQRQLFEAPLPKEFKVYMSNGSPTN